MSGRAATDAVIPGRCALSVGNPETELPTGWTWTPLSSLAELGTGHTPSRRHPAYWDGDVPWIGIRDASAHHGGVISDTLQHITPLGLENSSARLLPKDTVCLSRTASVGYVVRMGREMATSQDFVAWSCGPALDPDFLMKALLAEGSSIRRFGEGSTHTTIYFPEVKAFHITLPPVAEQRRIVARVDSLSAKSSRARAHLDHIPRLVEKYKQAILAAAFAGNLSRAARERHGWPRWQRELARNACAKVQSGGTPKDGFVSGGVPFLKVYNIVDQVVSFDYRPQFVERSVHNGLLKKSRALPGDVIMNIVGPPLGKVAIIPDTHPEWNFNQALTLFRPSAKVSSKWIYYYLCSGQSVRSVINKTKGSAGQVNVSLSQCRDFSFPVPSSQEQNCVVRCIETAFTWVDRLAAEATSATKLIANLDQAILAKAFRGELVPQSPTDEPASALLERIRAERRGAIARPQRAGRRS